MTLPAVRNNKLYHVSATSNRTVRGFAENGWKSRVPAAGRVMTLPYGLYGVLVFLKEKA